MSNYPHRLVVLIVPLFLGALSGFACNGAESRPAADPQATPEPAEAGKIALVIHGGAGAIQRSSLSEESEAEYRVALSAALGTGSRMLREGASSLDVVEGVIRMLEDEPLFNAGRGAVFTAEGRNELDASVMDGHTHQAGAVASVTTVRHPISAARAVMEKTPHVLLAGPGAEEFAMTQGLEIVAPEFFHTERRWKSLERARAREATGGGGGGGSGARGGSGASGALGLGTVGAVALDLDGRIAAGTSTGGMTNKRAGRIGDSPIIGAGTYANDQCGVSATGHGEFFIRGAIAFDICARFRYTEATLAESAKAVIQGTLAEAGGEGGVIALDSQGSIVMEFNTLGMYRGHVLADGEPQIAIFKDN